MLSCLTAVSVILSNNPVHSVLFLILTFFFSAGVVLTLKVDFLALIFIVVYVGAIAVLFLFVVMMIEIKKNSEKDDFSLVEFYGIGVFLSYFILELNIFLDYKVFESWNFSLSDPNEFFSFDAPSNTLLLGDILYDIYYIPFLLAGILLLVSMLGSILLTLNFNRGGLAQDSSRQLSRSDKFLSFLK